MAKRISGIILTVFGSALLIKATLRPNTNTGNSAYEQGQQTGSIAIYVTAVIIVLYGLKMVVQSFSKDQSNELDE
ncbi:MAG: hypothetical protein NE328_04920 [Lentisphaeraceae bacterium]|nr:hypothetical protein [Lentisphaeraceae bacterium]